MLLISSPKILANAELDMGVNPTCKLVRDILWTKVSFNVVKLIQFPYFWVLLELINLVSTLLIPTVTVSSACRSRIRILYHRVDVFCNHLRHVVYHFLSLENICSQIKQSTPSEFVLRCAPLFEGDWLAACYFYEFQMSNVDYSFSCAD